MFAQVKRFARSWSVAAAGMAAVLLVGGTPAAHAVTPRQDDLPPVGAEIPMSILALNTPVQIRSSLVTVDFRGGIKVRVDVNPDDPVNSRRLRIVGFKVSGELPGGDRGGFRRSGGTITLEQDDVDVDAPSLLRRTQQFPPRYEQIMVLSFTMTVDQPDARREPLVLVTKNPAQLVGRLTQFPPRGDLYQLQNPVDLVLPDEPDTTTATIQKFPAKLGAL
ncbi:hypothetical protein [Amycolatopsis sp. lyj-23]|uniref:hypothetical protein n=1 Tax=Amycolatopsis sp. lyj-23 TaxID=2789283 RepID=UPI00397ACDE4